MDNYMHPIVDWKESTGKIEAFIFVNIIGPIPYRWIKHTLILLIRESKKTVIGINIFPYQVTLLMATT